MYYGRPWMQKFQQSCQKLKQGSGKRLTREILRTKKAERATNLGKVTVIKAHHASGILRRYDAGGTSNRNYGDTRANGNTEQQKVHLIETPTQIAIPDARHVPTLTRPAEPLASYIHALLQQFVAMAMSPRRTEKLI